MMWKICGQTFLLWKDRWIPQPLTCRIQSPPTALYNSAKVHKLIDAVSWRWDVIMVKTDFNDMEANCILKIPLDMICSADKHMRQYLNLEFVFC